MNCKNILKSHGKLLEKDALDSLEILGRSLFGEKWDYVDSVSSSTTVENSNNQYAVDIAQNWLIYNCDENECNRAGYVLTVQHMYHEYQHVQQYTKEQNAIIDINSIKSINRMTDIVRRNFIRNFYNSAYTHNYANDPAELDAEVYGLKQTIEYFKSDPLITQNKAKEVLFQFMMSEDYGHKAELNKYSIKSIDDMMKAFIDLRDTAVHKPYPITLEISPLAGNYTASEYDMTSEFLMSYRYRTHGKNYKNVPTAGK